MEPFDERRIKELEENIRALDDQSLLAILRERDEYHDEAVKIAEDECRKRNLDIPDICPSAEESTYDSRSHDTTHLSRNWQEYVEGLFQGGDSEDVIRVVCLILILTYRVETEILPTALSVLDDREISDEVRCRVVGKYVGLMVWTAYQTIHSVISDKTRADHVGAVFTDSFLKLFDEDFKLLEKFNESVGPRGDGNYLVPLGREIEEAIFGPEHYSSISYLSGVCVPRLMDMEIESVKHVFGTPIYVLKEELEGMQPECFKCWQIVESPPSSHNRKPRKVKHKAINREDVKQLLGALISSDMVLHKMAHNDYLDVDQRLRVRYASVIKWIEYVLQKVQDEYGSGIDCDKLGHVKNYCSCLDALYAVADEIVTAMINLSQLPDEHPNGREIHNDLEKLMNQIEYISLFHEAQKEGRNNNE